MRCIVTLPENPEEVGRRFNEMVGAAVEQLNQGSLARASRMLDVAEKIVSENHVETATAENVRRRAQEAVDLERVRSLGEDPRNHEALGRILSFFPGFTPGRFIEELHGEEKRVLRRWPFWTSCGRAIPPTTGISSGTCCCLLYTSDA